MVFCSGVISSYFSGLNRSPTRTRLWGSGGCFDCLAGWALAIDIAPTPITAARKYRRRMVALLWRIISGLKRVRTGGSTSWQRREAAGGVHSEDCDGPHG